MWSTLGVLINIEPHVKQSPNRKKSFLNLILTLGQDQKSFFYFIIYLRVLKFEAPALISTALWDLTFHLILYYILIIAQGRCEVL